MECREVAAVRLAREENWDNSPRVQSRIADAIPTG
jgi:hypothetical protein